MSERRDIRADLEPDAAPELVQLAERLLDERPVPAAAFRGDLRRRLLAGDLRHGSRPSRLRVLIAGWAGGGMFLLLAGAASVAGLGPLAA
jgi:hypothetical protein